VVIFKAIPWRRELRNITNGRRDYKAYSFFIIPREIYVSFPLGKRVTPIAFVLMCVHL
jgi:hypothetical protein